MRRGVSRSRGARAPSRRKGDDPPEEATALVADMNALLAKAKPLADQVEKAAAPMLSVAATPRGGASAKADLRAAKKAVGVITRRKPALDASTEKFAGTRADFNKKFRRLTEIAAAMDAAYAKGTAAERAFTHMTALEREATEAKDEFRALQIRVREATRRVAFDAAQLDAEALDAFGADAERESEAGSGSAKRITDDMEDALEEVERAITLGRASSRATARDIRRARNILAGAQLAFQRATSGDASEDAAFGALTDGTAAVRGIIRTRGTNNKAFIGRIGRAIGALRDTLRAAGWGDDDAPANYAKVISIAKATTGRLRGGVKELGQILNAIVALEAAFDSGRLRDDVTEGSSPPASPRGAPYSSPIAPTDPPSTPDSDIAWQAQRSPLANASGTRTPGPTLREMLFSSEGSESGTSPHEEAARAPVRTLRTVVDGREKAQARAVAEAARMGPGAGSRGDAARMAREAVDAPALAEAGAGVRAEAEGMAFADAGENALAEAEETAKGVATERATDFDERRANVLSVASRRRQRKQGIVSAARALSFNRGMTNVAKVAARRGRRRVSARRAPAPGALVAPGPVPAAQAPVPVALPAPAPVASAIARHLALRALAYAEAGFDPVRARALYVQKVAALRTSTRAHLDQRALRDEEALYA